jgi:hypothetical protein
MAADDSRLDHAFDTVRFGGENILNLRERLPTVPEAVHRAEAWIRKRQVSGAKEVLVISGRGKGSEGGISPVREGIIRLIASLRRRGVVDRYEEHTAGSFSLQLASMRAMIDAPRRRRDAPKEHVPPGLTHLSAPARAMLRELAERSLDALGVKESSTFVDKEMERQLSAIVAAAPEQGRDDVALRQILKHALDQTL